MQLRNQISGVFVQRTLIQAVWKVILEQLRREVPV